MSDDEKRVTNEAADAERDRAVADFRGVFPEGREPALCVLISGGVLDEATADRIGRLPVETIRELRMVLAGLPPGARMEVSILREAPALDFVVVPEGSVVEVPGTRVPADAVPEAVDASPTAETVPVDVPEGGR